MKFSLELGKGYTLELSKRHVYYFIFLLVFGMLSTIYGIISYAQLPNYHDIGRNYIRNNEAISKALGGVHRVSNGRLIESTDSTATVEYIVNGVGSKMVQVFFVKVDSINWNVRSYELPPRYSP